MGRTSVDSTMTRAEHFAKAKQWGLAAAWSLAVAVAAIFARTASDSPLPRLLGVLALLGVGVAVVSAAYRTLMGLSRPANWRPLAGEPLAGFEPEEEERSLLKRVTQELGERVAGDIDVEHQNIVDSYPDDQRSAWQRFLQRSEPMLPRYRLRFSIPTHTRTIILSVWIGRSKHDASYSRIRIVLEGQCKASLSAPVSWRGEFAGNGSATTSALSSDKTLTNVLKGLVRKRILSGGRWILHPDPAFLLEPLDGGTGARVILDTVEQDWKGGFVTTLGLDGFLTAVDRVESLLAEVSPATPST